MTAPKQKTNQVGPRLVAFIAVFCIIASLALVRNGSFFGCDASSFFSSDKETTTEDNSGTVPAIRYEGDQQIINTSEIGKDISGYAGPVPL